MTPHDLVLVPAHDASPAAGPLDQATAAYLTRLTGSSREHARSDLRCFLTWCAERNPDPLDARRPHLELYVRWMQEIRHFKPSTVSRRFSVVAGFYRTAVIDAVLDHSPADHVRRPRCRRSHRPWDSPTCSSKRCSPPAASRPTRATSHSSPCSDCSHCGFEATSANIADLDEEHGHRVLRVCGKGTKMVLIPLPPAASGISPASAEYASAAPTRTCCGIPSSPRCSTQELTSETSKSPPATPTRATTRHARISTATRTTSSPLTWPPARERVPDRLDRHCRRERAARHACSCI
jgi:integrase/recombinase XerD